MRILKLCLVFGLLIGLAGCSKFKTYNGPEVTRIQVWKEARVMRLYHHGEVLEEYDIGLGFAPMGHKQVEGDGRTPEGRYFVDRKNPNSRFHLSLGISYPNATDIEVAHELGQSPGGDIFIHGTSKPYVALQRKGDDWTWGCISVKNREIEQIYAMVKTGTVIDIYP